ncbi:MAG TPA: hypothetical protein EYQ27_02255 [Gemmatimonadetes bacterium]|nr:hypothetical protein [Gemmatimonadota bacterium]
MGPQQHGPDRTGSWTSSDAAVATVTASAGLLISVAEGTSTITAAVGSVTAAISVTVAEGSATYDVVFESVWSAATHPTDFPSNPHFRVSSGARTRLA